MTAIFVGNLPTEIDEETLRSHFAKHGQIACIRLKVPSRPPAFAFIVHHTTKRIYEYSHKRLHKFRNTKTRKELMMPSVSPTGTSTFPSLFTWSDDIVYIALSFSDLKSESKSHVADQTKRVIRHPTNDLAPNIGSPCQIYPRKLAGKTSKISSAEVEMWSTQM